MTLPMTPSSASTSRTSVPFPTPPIDGLHESSPMVSSVCVSSTVRAPVRAAPVAASHPACPPPITTTKFRLVCGEMLQRNEAYRHMRLILTLARHICGKLCASAAKNFVGT